MTTDQVAESLNVTRSRVRQLLLDGEIQGEKLGRDWVVRRGEVTRYRRKVQGLPLKRAGRKHKAAAAPPPAGEENPEGGQS